MKEYVTFGISSIDELNFTHIDCEAGLKPIGGIFAYEYDQNGKYISQYERWCEEEFINRGDLRKCIKYTISQRASIYIVNGWGDFHEILKKFPKFKTVDTKEGKVITDICIDYDKFAKKYDGIEFTNKGIVNTDIEDKHLIDVGTSGILRKEKNSDYIVKGLIEVNTSGWVVPCRCIFNPNVIENVTVIKNRNIHMLDDNETFDELSKEIDKKRSNEELMDFLLKYYNGGKESQEFINLVKQLKKNDKKYDSLIERIKGLLVVQEQMAGSIDFRKDIDKAIEGLHKISAPEDDFDEFYDHLQEILKAERISQVKIENKKKIKTSDEMMDEIFSGVM